MTTTSAAPSTTSASAGPQPRRFRFVAGPSGPWRITSIDAFAGESLETAARLSILEERLPEPVQTAWTLRGITSNERYVARDEKRALVARQQGLGRAPSNHAALIPIRKSAAWWALAQDERRAILEEQSHHIAIGMRHLPAIARRLHHCRDLGHDEPFDFLTWFEYAADDEAGFDALVRELRTSPEWAYVEREVDIRLVRDDA